MLSLKHRSDPVDPKLEIHFFSPVKGAQNQMSLGQKPKYIFIYFLKPPLRQADFSNIDTFKYKRKQFSEYKYKMREA